MKWKGSEKVTTEQNEETGKETVQEKLTELRGHKETGWDNHGSHDSGRWEKKSRGGQRDRRRVLGRGKERKVKGRGKKGDKRKYRAKSIPRIILQMGRKQGVHCVR